MLGGLLGGAFFGPLARHVRRRWSPGRRHTCTAPHIPLALLDTALVLTAVLAMVDKRRT